MLSEEEEQRREERFCVTTAITLVPQQPAVLLPRAPVPAQAQCECKARRCTRKVLVGVELLSYQPLITSVTKSNQKMKKARSAIYLCSASCSLH